MILTAHQPTYLPWLGLFHKIALADRFILFDQVQYVPYDWISRNTIKGPNGPFLLTIPVDNRDHMSRKICDIEIRNDLHWAKKHWLSLVQGYQKAPFFKSYAGFFEDTYKREWKYLADLNLHMLSWFLDTLGIRTPVERAGEYSFKGAKSALVLDMCRRLESRIFIFGALGSEYADTEEFRRQGVIPYFQSYVHPTYPQRFGDFVPNMSVVDLLFNVGPASLDIIMSCNASRSDIRMLQ